MLRRLLAATFAYAVATGCGAVFLAVAAFSDPATRSAGFDAAIAGIFAIIDAAFWGERPEAAATALANVLQAILVAVVIAPLAVAALVGEVARVRAWVWYAGASAFVAAASPWIARAAKGLNGQEGLERVRSVSALEGRIALLFFLTGTVTGTVYWLIAGRNAGLDRGGPRTAPRRGPPPPKSPSPAALPPRAPRAAVPPIDEKRSGDQDAAEDEGKV